MQNSKSQMYDRRRNYYIKKEFQRKFILKYVGMVLGGVVVSAGALHYLLKKGLDDVFYRAHIGIVTTGDVTRSPLLLTGAAVVAVAALAVLAFTTFDSKRINEKLRRFAEGVKGIKRGDLTVRIVSEGNDMGDLVCSFNTAVEELNKKVASVKAKIIELEEMASALQSRKGESAAGLLSQIESIEKEMSAFKFQGPEVKTQGRTIDYRSAFPMFRGMSPKA